MAQTQELTNPGDSALGAPLSELPSEVQDPMGLGQGQNATSHLGKETGSRLLGGLADIEEKRVGPVRPDQPLNGARGEKEVTETIRLENADRVICP
jgi:hypothetical protein